MKSQDSKEAIYVGVTKIHVACILENGNNTDIWYSMLASVPAEG